MIDGYQLISVVGTGGMSIVFRARNQATGQLVALKLASAASEGPCERSVLENEAQMLGRVDSPHVPTLVAYGRDKSIDRSYVAMSLVEGPTLANVVDETGPLDPGRGLAVLRQLAGALCAVHGAGIVHRDAKPSNLIMSTTADGQEHLVLIDFGLACPIVTADRHAPIVGTPRYMSPEQLRGGPADPRNDLFSLGCTARELLAGPTSLRRQVTAAAFGRLDSLLLPTHIPSSLRWALCDLDRRLLHPSIEGRPPTSRSVATELKALETAYQHSRQARTPVAPALGMSACA